MVNLRPQGRDKIYWLTYTSLALELHTAVRHTSSEWRGRTRKTSEPAARPSSEPRTTLRMPLSNCSTEKSEPASNTWAPSEVRTGRENLLVALILIVGPFTTCR